MWRHSNFKSEENTKKQLKQKTNSFKESKASANLLPSGFSLHSHTKDAKSASYTASDNRPPTGKEEAELESHSKCEILQDELSHAFP